jgi:hypothetical protein
MVCAQAYGALAPLGFLLINCLRLKKSKKNSYIASGTNFQTMPTLYSLNVGINNYPAGVSALQGCVPDAKALNAYFEAYAAARGWAFASILLLDEAATRQGIIDGFRLFDEAKDGDYCVWSFAGHGSRYPVPPEFTEVEADGMHESLVCYDSRLPGGRDLFDKENAWLVWNATKNKNVHFLALMDCCHSGTNLRLDHTRVRAAREDKTATPVPIEDYLGIADYLPLGNGKLKPPTGHFVQLAACQPDQYAMEQNRADGVHGVFSYALLETFAQVGRALTYRELMQWVSGKVKHAVTDQAPQLNVTSDGYLNMPVLGEGQLSETIGGLKAYFSRKDRRWTVDVGAIHGIAPGDRLLLHAEPSSVEAKVEEVYPGHAALSVEGQLSSKQLYAASFKHRNARVLAVAFSPELSAETQAVLRSAFEELKPGYVQLQAEAEAANYWVAGLPGDAICLTRKANISPVFGRRPLDQAATFWKEVNQVGKWEYLFDLSNPLTTLPSSSLAFELKTYAPAAYPPVIKSEGNSVPWPGPLKLNQLAKVPEGVYPYFSVRVANNSSLPLHVAVLYLANDYSVSTILSIPEALAPGVSQPLLYGDSELVPVTIEKCIADIGVSVNPERLKVIASTTPFATDGFAEENGLCPDVRQADRGMPDIEKAKGIKAIDWTAFNIDLVNYQPQQAVRLQAGTPVRLWDQALTIAGAEGGWLQLFCEEELEDAPLSYFGVDRRLLYRWTPGFNRAPGLTTLGLTVELGAGQTIAGVSLQVVFPASAHRLKPFLLTGHGAVELGYNTEGQLLTIKGLLEPSGDGANLFRYYLFFCYISG